MRSRIFPSYLSLYPLWVCLFLLQALATQANEPFPRPAELERDVDFWRQVYTRIDTNSGFIHDANNLAIVYETLELSGQRRADNKAMKAAIARYAAILRRLATGRDNLNTQEQRVLSLWGPDVSASRLREAAGDVRFQRGQSDRFRAGLARSGEWRDFIEEVLTDKNLPRELAALPHVESSFNPEAYSSVGAAGIWQFTRSTGRRYLHIDYVVDERMDPFASTTAAAQLLEHNYQLTGTWPLALTAYNHGTAGVRRAKRELGTSDIATIVRNFKGRSFGFASRNFYVSFLAAAEISADPKRFFGSYQAAKPLNYTQVTLPDYLPVDAFALAFDTDLSLLKHHNRALLEPVWMGKKRIPRGYTMRIPRDSLPAAPEQLLAAIPDDQRFDKQVPDLFHKVVPGDSVSEIAYRYGHSIRDIAAMNGLNSRYTIRAGQMLRLPLEGAVASVEVNASTEPQALQAALTQLPIQAAQPTADEMAQELPAIEVTVDLSADPSDYTVASDDSIEVQAAETLGHYAEWLDLRASQLRRINGMRYGRPVVIGHRLKLDFSRIDKAEFERRRLAYQADLQQSFFMTWQIRATRKHVIAPGESLWVLTQRRFKVPMWLLRQYNPDLDLDKVHPGTVIVIPELAAA